MSSVWWGIALDTAYRVSAMTHTVVAELVADVQEVLVEVGASVKATDELLLLDSMKMEIPVLAEVEGTVTEVLVKAGDHISAGDPLVVIGRG